MQSLLLFVTVVCVTAQRDFNNQFNNLGTGQRDRDRNFNSVDSFNNNVNNQFNTRDNNQFTPNFAPNFNTNFSFVSPNRDPFNNPRDSFNNPRDSFNNPRDPFNSQRDPFNPNTGGGINRQQQFNSFNPGRDFGDNVFSFSPSQFGLEERKCPTDWVLFRQSCYRFVRSPIHNREGARLNCQAYGNGSTLVNVNSLEEHGWIVRHLSSIDRQRRFWYVAARQEGPGSWVNEDQSPLLNLDQAFLPEQPNPSFNTNNRYLVYSYSDKRNRWGLLKVPGIEMYLYICERPLALVPLTSDERDFDYGLDILDPKKIPRGPYFIRQPQSAVFDLSRNIPRPYITLTCVAAGWPSPTYKWYKEEYDNSTLMAKLIEPLKMAKYTVSGGTLMIDNPKQKDDRGNYHCIAANEFGSIVSETVSISFGYISEFILARSDDQGKQYWGKSIYCDAPQHFPGVYYLWARKYFPNLVEEDQRVFVSYDGNLYISAVDMSDQGNYSCNVQSKVSPTGRNGPFFNLQVTPNANYQQLKFADYFPKVFPESPKASEEIRLECVSFGYPVPSYNWTRKDASLPRNAQLSNYNRVLTIPNATVEDEGTYSCRATNSRLSIVGSVTLRIQASPEFNIELGNRHVDKGSDLTWTCEAFGIPDVSYQWYRNGKLLMHINRTYDLPPEDVGRYYIQDNVLTIKNVDVRSDPGMYQCRANNSLAAKFSSGQLRVLILPPSFKKRPLDAEILAAEGGNITIRCDPEAAPRPRFLWRKDGNLIGSGGRRQVLPSGSLLINPVSREDQGEFTCIAQNYLGTDESSGRLSVLRGPTLVDPLPESKDYAVGSHLILSCRAEADSSLDVAYYWKHNGMRLEPSYRIRVDTRTGYLNIYNLTLADRGDYECEVSTWVGKLRAITRVHIIGPPGSPGGVQAADVTAASAKIRWTDGAMNGASAHLYTVQGRTQWDQMWISLVENVTARPVERDRDNRDSRLSLAVTGRKEIELKNVLSPWSAYEFRVAAANQFGYGPWSAASPQHNTPPDRPSAYPRNIGGGGGKTGTLTIKWEPLPPKDQNAPGIYYKIFWRRYKEDVEDEYQTLVLQKWGNIGMHVVAIPSQYYYTLYDVKVQAWNSEGPGPESPAVQTYSAEDMPQVAPSLVIPRIYNSTAINVTWIPVEETREKIRGNLTGYRIRYWPKKDNNFYDPQALNYLSRSTRPWALILGLQPNTYYYVQVMAYNQAGPGPASEAQFERTTKRAPQKPPTSVNVIAVDPSTIRVTWRYVSTSTDEEALSGYKVRVWEADQDIVTANDTWVQIGNRNKLEATISGLQPEKPYFLRILGYSAGGDGKMSSPAQEFILALRNSAIQEGVRLSAILSSLVLTWMILKLT